jgi:hypothetical protein
VKDENGDLLADSHNILNRWKNYFSQLLNVHIHTLDDTKCGPACEKAECRDVKLK